jgi:hypothetical protein
VRSVSEWAEVRALAADGVSQREIAARLEMNRRTVKRLAEAAEPPRYRRAPSGSMLDLLDPVLRKLVADFEDIKAPRVTELLREEYGVTGVGRSGPHAAAVRAALIGEPLHILAGVDPVGVVSQAAGIDSSL